MSFPTSPSRRIAEPVRYLRLSPDAKVRGLGETQQAIVPGPDGVSQTIEYNAVLGFGTPAPRDGVLAIHGPYYLKDVKPA